MKNWRPLMFFFLFIVFLSFDLSASELLKEFKSEIKQYQTNPYPRQRSLILELAKEVETIHQMKIDWPKLNLLNQGNLDSNSKFLLSATLNELEKKTQNLIDEQSQTNNSYIGIIFIALLTLSMVTLFSRGKKKKQMSSHYVLSKRNKPLSLELKGLSFVLNHKGQLVEMSDEVNRTFQNLDKDNFSKSFNSHLVYLNIKSSNNLVKIKNVKEFENKLFYYKSNTFQHSGKSFRFIKLVEVQDLGRDLGKSANLA